MNNYIDIDEQLNGFEAVPIVCRGQLPYIGKLDKRATQTSLNKNAMLNIPLCLMEEVRDLNCFIMMEPSQMNEKNMHTMKLDSINYNPQFYNSQNYYKTLKRMTKCMKTLSTVDKEKHIQDAFQNRQTQDKNFPYACNDERDLFALRSRKLEYFNQLQNCILK